MISTVLAMILSTTPGWASGDEPPSAGRTFNLWDPAPPLPAVFLSEESDSLASFTLQDDADRKDRDAGFGFAIGPFGGFLEQRDADDGTWFAGLGARLYFLRFLAAEASVSFHRSDFNDGDTEVWQIPVQLSALLIILPGLPIRPYIGGGVGWYYTRIENSGPLSVFGDDTSNWFGGHAIAGAEIRASRGFILFGDFRYIWVNPDNDIEDRTGDPNYWQITFGLLFGY
jgi:hypothetical protein